MPARSRMRVSTPHVGTHLLVANLRCGQARSRRTRQTDAVRARRIRAIGRSPKHSYGVGARAARKRSPASLECRWFTPDAAVRAVSARLLLSCLLLRSSLLAAEASVRSAPPECSPGRRSSCGRAGGRGLWRSDSEASAAMPPTSGSSGGCGSQATHDESAAARPDQQRGGRRRGWLLAHASESQVRLQVAADQGREQAPATPATAANEGREPDRSRRLAPCNAANRASGEGQEPITASQTPALPSPRASTHEFAAPPSGVLRLNSGGALTWHWRIIGLVEVR